MPRLSHGSVVTESAVRHAREEAALRAPDALAFAADPQPTLGRFDYLFPDLQNDPDALLPQDDPAKTVKALRKLADAMGDDNQGESSEIPAAYTYLGQFIDHDITLEAHSDPTLDTTAVIVDDGLTPLPLAQARSVIQNLRAATLDLDSVYGSEAPHDPLDINKMLLGEVSPTGSTEPPRKRPTGKEGDDFHDVPRLDTNVDPRLDRAARIGDHRNDENTIISQLQVAFLRAHNALVDAGFTFEQARSILRQHYQHIVIHDFLKQVARDEVVDAILTDGNRVYDALGAPFFLPFEFSVAAYRFGHTMVRAEYDFNENFNLEAIPASLELLFTFTALSGQLGDFKTLPENWIIQWENIIGDDLGPGGRARSLDTTISALIGGQPRALFGLRKVTGEVEPGLAARLASRNLLRGYWLRMPTGQAVARELGIKPLTPKQLLAAVTEAQKEALEEGGFTERTPLWFYLLAEAAHTSGDGLGPLGSTIVAEVLIGLTRRSEDSILKIPGWLPALPAKVPGSFDLADLLRFAGVLDGGADITTYVVKPKDTLSSIARKQLGAAERWPEIFAANRTIVRNPDTIFPGMRLIIPAGSTPDPQLRFVVVKRNDTLSGLAKTHLGAANRAMEIFKLNRAVLTDPDVIVVGQVLQLPAR